MIVQVLVLVQGAAQVAIDVREAHQALGHARHPQISPGTARRGCSTASRQGAVPDTGPGLTHMHKQWFIVFSKVLDLFDKGSNLREWVWF